VDNDKTRITPKTSNNNRDDDKTRIVSPQDKTVAVTRDDKTRVNPELAAFDEKTVLNKKSQGRAQGDLHDVENEKTRLKTPTAQSSNTSPPSFLSTNTLAHTSSHPLDRAPDIGDTIKQRFVLHTLLGVGGMGAVYRALDLRKQEAGDDRPYIAIKLLGEEFKEHPQAFITLQREAKKTQDLAHPNIVTVYDFDRDGDLVYLTMEELKGCPLNDLLAGRAGREPLDYREKLAMIREIAEGLAYAHSKGIVHSDLKPANLFVSDSGHIKILDFGIARAANEELYQDSFDAGELGALTFTYASPEMISFKPPHPSDDIYALGVIACEILGDFHPFDGQDAQRALEKKLSPKLPKLRNPLLKKVLTRALAFERGERIEDASAFLRQLNFAISGPRRFVLATTLVIAVAIGNLIYLEMAVPPEGPPFSSLPAEAQESFKSHLTESQRALQFGDVQGAVFNIDSAYQIHSHNDDIKKAVAQIKTLFETNIAQAEDDKTRVFYQQQWEQLQRYPAFADSDIKN
jgi:serine/threonine protein kinase